ncbi:MAG TPA: 3'(2'),5'-bisphosphate nucleotidase CysQ [Stellaceae bacterium]
MSADRGMLLEIARAAALAAGAAIMEVYAGDFSVERKADDSPVTRADRRAEAIILERLRAAAPDIPIIAEEEVAAYGLPASAPPRFWLVDPLDGTKEFIRRNGEFTVNIALVEGDGPVLGIVHAPVPGVTYAASGTATRQHGSEAPRPIAARPVPARRAVIVHSRSHADEQRLAAYAAEHPEAERRVAGSSIKFCLIAAGEADLYPRFGPTCEWDTAAGQAVLEAAGGAVTTLNGARLRYGKPGFLNPDFIARGRS